MFKDIKEARAKVRGLFSSCPSRVAQYLRIDECEEICSRIAWPERVCNRLLECGNKEVSQHFRFNGVHTVPTFAIEGASENGEAKQEEIKQGAGEKRHPQAIEKPRVDPKVEQLTELITSLSGGVTENKVREILKEEIERAKLPQKLEIEVKANGKSHKIEGKQHYLFPLMLKVLASGCNLCLVGPSGSGKTHALIEAAKALNIEYIAESFGPTSTKTDLVGYCDANGEFVPGKLYRAMKEGLLFLADEFDACHPGVALILNACAANRTFTFPNNETVAAKDSFVLCFGMNTLGLGATQDYVGRNRLDAATLDRLVTLHVPYDESLEASFLGIEERGKECDVEQGGTATKKYWLALVRNARKAVEKTKLPVILSPRVTLHGFKLLEQGVGLDHVKEMTILARLSPEQRARFIPEWDTPSQSKTQ